MGNKKVENLFYDNTASGIVADNVQDAIDEVLSSATNIYTADGTITANRNVNLNNHGLNFNNMAQFAMYGANAELEYDGVIFKVAASGFGEMEYGHQDSMMCYATQTDVNFEIKSTALHVKFTDLRGTGSQVGIEYDGDYSADFVARSLVDKAYVDNNHGTLQQATDASIAADGYVHVEFGASQLEDDGGAAVWEPLPGGYELEFKDGGSASIYLKSESSVGAGDSVFAFRDDRAGAQQVGVIYQADYSAGFVNRSLVDKEYVDGHVGTSVFDADGDTGIQVERTADDDTIYMQARGQDAFKISNTIIGGKSILIGDFDGDGNETKLEINDIVREVTFNGLIASFGDIEGNGNEVILTVDDASQMIQAYQSNLSVTPAMGSTTTGEFRMLEDPNNGIEYVGFKASSALTTSVMWTLPDADGLAGQVLSTDGASVLSWQDPTILNILTVSTATSSPASTVDVAHVTRTASGACTITILTANITAGYQINIKDAAGNAGTNNITIVAEGSETIDGDTSYVINTDYEAITLYSDGSNLFIK